MRVMRRVRSHLCIAAAGAIQSWKSRRHWSASPHARPAFIGRTAPVDELPALPKRPHTTLHQHVAVQIAANASRLQALRAKCSAAWSCCGGGGCCATSSPDLRCALPCGSQNAMTKQAIADVATPCCPSTCDRDSHVYFARVQPRKPVFSAVTCNDFRPRTQQTTIDFGPAS
jgi:hypothetical protein